MTDDQVKSVQDGFDKVSALIGAQSRALAIIVGALHQQDVLNGNAIAASIRLDLTGQADADDYAKELADLIRRTVDRVENQATIGLGAVPD